MMKVEWLRQVFIKAGAETAFAVIALLMCGQSNSFFPRLALSGFDHEIKTAPIRQADIAHQDVEVKMIKQEQCILDIGRGRDFVAAMGEQARKDHSAVVVVLD